MVHIVADRVRETTTTTGTGAVTLAGAVAGFRAFSSVMANGDTCRYAIVGGTEWEVGLGSWGTGGILTRTTVLASSNANALVTFSAGTKDVWLNLDASSLPHILPDNSFQLTQATAVPPVTPASGKLGVFTNKRARQHLAVIGPRGIDYPVQPALFQQSVYLWWPTTATTGLWLGTVGAGAGTYTTQLPTNTSIYTGTKRARWANVVTTTNQVLGQRNTEAMFRAGNAAGIGGYFFYARCGFDVWTNGGRFFAGMHTATTVVSADPSALNNTVGFCIDAADNGAISFLTRGTAATKASTGLTAVTGKGYDVAFYVPANGTSYDWFIEDLNTGTTASGNATANLPTSTTLLTAGVLASNAALTTVTAIQLGVNKIYVETDY